MSSPNVNVYLVMCFILGGMLILQLFFQMRCTDNENYAPSPQYSDTCTETIDISTIKVNVSNIPRQIFDVAMYLKKARIHARGSKTQRALKHASEHMDAILKGFGTSFEDATKRKVHEPSSMCPEYYVDKMNGYKIRECSHAKPLDQIVTILRLDHGSPTNTKFIKDTYDTNIPMIVGDYGGNVKEKSNVRVKNMASSVKEGDALNTLMKEVKTKYTLVLRNVIGLDSNARLERLVREIEILNLNAVGGAIRNSDNVWSLGCHQRVFQNFTMVYKEGYDESMHDCVLCDHVDGPFLIKTEKLNQIKFDSSLTSMGLYEDFFIRLNTEVAICADSLFDMDFPRRSKITNDWEKFGRKRNLYRLKFSFGLTIDFGCNYAYPCQRQKGFIRSPCCIQELADLSFGFMDMCEKINASCQLNAGSILSAVKMYNIIPWEADADLNFWCQDFTRLKNAGLKLSSRGIRVGVEHLSNCAPKAIPAQLGARSKHWHADIWSRDTMESYEVRSKLRNLTRIPHNGHLVNGMRNPALFARNMYSNIFLHRQHFREVGTKKIYIFSKCPKGDAHDCIDNYYTDGNIQFQDPIA
ncbi:uncharacterized protein LOC117329774 [Pecten maximus]|uniref:uncharacterized protein LOC117329774 n=1 Tax=Pecten maximus TaxID=6579 RepID=UPI001458FBB0|nr:uncharacterized protein LOC117329774 [Pecten maximus]